MAKIVTRAVETPVSEPIPASPVKPAFRLSDEQLTIAAAVQAAQNILVRARAGTGKTTLLMQCLPLMSGEIAIAAFNRKIAREIQDKLIKSGVKLRTTYEATNHLSGIDVGTFHSFGWRVLRRANRSLRLEGRSGKDAAGFYKFEKLIERLHIPASIQSLVRKAMERAQERLIGVTVRFNDKQAWLDLADHFALELELPADDHIDMQLLRNSLDREASIEDVRMAMLQKGLSLAAKAIQESARMATEELRVERTTGRGDARQTVLGEKFTGVVSFSEMLYLPLYFNLDIPKFDWVLVDEFQDSNPARREFARRMMKPNGHFFGVADDRQGIYGFAGADADAMETAITLFGCKVLPMTKTFRCGKAIVNLAKTIVPDYQADDSNPVGEVVTIDEEAFHKLDLVPSDAVICRNTAPLVQVAYKLLARGIRCHVEGKDIGKSLIPLLYRWSNLKSLTIYTERLQEYRDAEMAKLNEQQKESAADGLNDRVETILAIIAAMPKDARLPDVQERVNALFADTDGEKIDDVILLTAHRSKGLEFPRVFAWGVNKYMPSKNAKQPWQQEQEKNLEYVLYTRAIDKLILVNV